MYDVTIIGCGVIGASLAYTLSQYKLRLLIVEQENDVAMGTTKANSAIVHAGYDPPNGSLMASLNVRGSAMMEELCRKLAVRYQRLGSLVLAFNQTDINTLREMYENGLKNGVPNLRLLTREEALEMEPKLAHNVCGALYAPSAGVVDPWGLCLAQAEVAVRNGAELKLRCKVQHISQEDGYYTVETTNGTFRTRYIVNCAGVQAHEIERLTGERTFEPCPSRGEYYLLDKSSGDLVNHVIFQCPTAAGKGVLVSPTVHGNLIVGPNAVPTDTTNDTATTASGLREVAAAARRSVPSVDFRQSIRNFAGVRAITDQPDFIIRPSSFFKGLLHLAGIKSPGLSAAPAIAVYAAEQLAQMGLALEKKADYITTRSVVSFKSLSTAEKAEWIQKNPLYARVICRCETITEGEILDAIASPIPPCSIDGVKRRAGAGMGRCQGGFCGPRVMEILARTLGVPQSDILQDQDGSYVITGETKTGGMRE